MSRPLRVAHVLHYLAPGGVPNVVAGLTRGMVAAGAEVELITGEPKLELDLPEGVVHRPVTISGVSSSPRFANAARYFGKKTLGTRRFRFTLSRWFCRQLLSQALAPGEHDLVFLHGLFFLPFWRLKRDGVFVVAHCNKSRMLLKARTRWINERRRRMFSRAYGDRRLVAVSQGVADDLVENFGVAPQNVTAIHNPFDFADLRARAAEPNPLDLNAPYIASLGRLSAKKRFDVLLRAFAAAKVPHHLVLVGDGSQRGALERLSRELGVADRVHLLGFIDNPFPVIRGAELFALSSDQEGFGNVLVEALACGTPVVSTDCPSGPAEILSGPMARGLVPPGDVPALAAKLEEVLLRDPLPVDEDSLTRFDQYAVAKAYLKLASV
ncbi:MAG: glycosyltransferase [Planctomycetota bacterium]